MTEQYRNELQGLFEGPFTLSAGKKRREGTEWLETNGRGAFASSSITEKQDRKYHGLLVTPIEGGEGRIHVLSAVDASFEIPGLDSGLSMGTASYPGVFHPEGWKSLARVELLPFPAWTYRKGRVEIRKEIFMRSGEKGVYLVYTLIQGARKLAGALKFLFTFRDSHGLTKANENLDPSIRELEEGFSLKPYAPLPAAAVLFSGEWERRGEFYWDYNICYEREKERGFDHMEDRFVPGTSLIHLKQGKPFVIKVLLQDDVSDSLSGGEGLVQIYEEEKTGRIGPGKIDSPLDLLKNQAHHFLLKNPSGSRSINAGYPWFGEWGRDTMLALPGLTFYNGRRDLAASILGDYSALIKDGLLPNTLGDTQGFTSYNSMDAGLLFCWAVGKIRDGGYGKKKKEKAYLGQTLLPAVASICGAFLENRVPGAHLTEKGLLYSGSPDTQLTWMDATAWGHPVTPRWGLAVDLNALWYDALVQYKELAALNKTEFPVQAQALLKQIPEAFRETFLLKEGYAADSVNDYGADTSIRPNMLFASSASPGLLTKEQRQKIVRKVEAELLTPFGLRTLNPGHPAFQPVYGGSSDQRDSQYHQGTVWPWLIGILVESSLKTGGDVVKKRKFWFNYLNRLLEEHITRDGWGSVAEIFDGLDPKEGKGCFAQAWSCGEIIRAAALLKSHQTK